MNSKNRVEELLGMLGDNKIDCCTIHGLKGQNQRAASLKEFTLGNKNILISTDLLSRGIDFPKVQNVINFDFPK